MITIFITLYVPSNSRSVRLLNRALNKKEKSIRLESQDADADEADIYA